MLIVTKSGADCEDLIFFVCIFLCSLSIQHISYPIWSNVVLSYKMFGLSMIVKICDTESLFCRGFVCVNIF